MLKLLHISEIEDSTQIIYWPAKSDWKVDWSNLQTRSKKLKKYWKIGTELFIDDNTKISEIYILPQFLSTSEKYCEIHWLDSYNLLPSKNSKK